MKMGEQDERVPTPLPQPMMQRLLQREEDEEEGSMFRVFALTARV